MKAIYEKNRNIETLLMSILDERPKEAEDRDGVPCIINLVQKFDLQDLRIYQKINFLNTFFCCLFSLFL